MRRTISALIAVVSAFLLTVTIAPAHARTDVAPVVNDDRAALRAPLPAHDVRREEAGKVSRSKFYVKAKVVTYKGKVVRLQKQNEGATHPGAPWRTIGKKRTDRVEGKYRFEFRGDIHDQFRVLIPKTDRNRRTYANQIKIIRQA